MSLSAGAAVLLGTGDGLYVLSGKVSTGSCVFAPVVALNDRLGADKAVRDVAQGHGQAVAAAASGLFRSANLTQWEPLFPSQGPRSWAPRDVRGVTFGGASGLWFASPHGVGNLLEGWTLYTGRDGLPYNDFTALASADDGVIWFGTTRGAIRFDGAEWRYRQGRRWLPDDAVRDVAVAADGTAWFATAAGVASIEPVPMTLAEKAAFYEDEIDRYHRRTPYGYVLEARLTRPGDKTEWANHDSDNDGLWTAMYGAGECFAYAATRSASAKKRAKDVFEALRFLGTVTQGGEHTPPAGFVARTILPTDGPDPNAGRLERDRRERAQGDALWKVIDPRWPTSEDGKWYWKSDTSSDELDGHYFFYALYYDLVADDDAERRRVRDQVQALTDHLVAHGFNLVDHDGLPTRWARYSPKELNFDQNWFSERGLNSLSILSYLAVTEHVTGQAKYGAIAEDLVRRHGYAQNLLYPKIHRGAGTGNQSDDEMAFMCYYNLINYEDDPELRRRYLVSFWMYWRLERPEMNPFFNFAFAARAVRASFADAWGVHDLSPTGDWLEDSIETLKRFPLDRIDWRHTNSHRLDIVRLPRWTRGFDEVLGRVRGHRVNGKVLPVDERHFNHWNTDPWTLDQGGHGATLSDGTVFLLPYYMGLYHRFIE